MSKHWARSRAFSVAEAATIISVPESTARDWLASGAAPYASGKKSGVRILSTADIFVLAITKQLIAAGYPIIVAAAEAWRIAGGTEADPQGFSSEEVFLGALGGGELGSVILAHELDVPEHVGKRGVAYVPAGQIARDVVAACLSLYGEQAFATKGEK